MEIGSIEEIKGSLEGLDESADSINTSKFKGQSFGEEQEFTAKSLVTSTKAIVSDIRGQVGKPERFVKITTANERRQIASNLNILSTSLREEQFSSVAQVLQELKVILRPFHLRGSSETREQLEAAVDDLHRQISAIKEERRKIVDEHAKLLELAANVSGNLDQSGVRLKEIEDVGTTLNSALEDAQQRIAKINEIKEDAALAFSNTEESQKNANASKELIEGFANKITEREAQLVDQQAKTNTFTESLAEHQKKMAEIEDSARKIIDSARTALSYKTAEGLSAAFIERYRETKEDSQRKLWLFAAGTLVVAAVALGIWITWDTTVTLAVVAGRVSLIPILIGGAWFCAHQYVKLANISEEYAYKSVLSKSIVGFSEQMSKENNFESDHSHYIRTVLAEIHTNPLRGPIRNTQINNLSPSKEGSAESAENLLKILTEAQKLIKQP